MVGIWWLFNVLSLLERQALTYIAMTFDILLGPLVFLVAMCRTRVAFLFKKYFCVDECCCCCILVPGRANGTLNGGGNFSNEEEDEFIEADCQVPI